MITRRTFTASLLSAVPATGLLGRAAFAQDMRDITFVQPSPSAINSFPVFTAIGEGFFAEEGLNVTVEAINGSGAVLQALSAGQAHFGRPGPGPLLAARTRGVEAVHIYNVAARSNFGIAVQEDSEYTSIEDLRGKVIGTGTADGAEVGFARNVLTGAGMTEGEDYTFLTVGDGGLPQRGDRRLFRLDGGHRDPQPARHGGARHHAGGVQPLLRQRHRDDGRHHRQRP